MNREVTRRGRPADEGCRRGRRRRRRRGRTWGRRRGPIGRGRGRRGQARCVSGGARGASRLRRRPKRRRRRGAGRRLRWGVAKTTTPLELYYRKNPYDLPWVLREPKNKINCPPSFYLSAFTFPFSLFFIKTVIGSLQSSSHLS